MQGPSEEDEDDVVSEMNVIPFIDICLVLLIIVLMTSASQSNFKKLTLPKAEATEYRDMNLAITLSVGPSLKDEGDEKSEAKKDDKGNVVYQYYFEDEDKPIEAKNLWTALKTIQGGNTWSMLVIRADQDTPYEHLALAIQCAQALGIEDINLAVKSTDDTTQD